MKKITMRAARVNVGMTCKEAAKRLGISEHKLRNIELYRSIPNAQDIANMCELYDAKYSNLIFFHPDTAKSVLK